LGLSLARARAPRALLLVGLVFAALPAGSALAATTVGQTGPSLTNAYLFGGEEDVASPATIPFAGTVTSFQTQSSVCNFAAGGYDFQILRPEGGNQYLVVGDTGNQTDPCDGQPHSYAVNIPVQAGDVLGVYVVTNWEGVLTVGGPSLPYGAVPEPTVGQTVALSFSAPGIADESATLVPSASVLAAILVADSTGKAPGTALVDKAIAIQTAVNANQTATACADITDYLGLVQAQTGKKLTTGANGTAALLTTDADNLAAALGC
jgi:hypothetical protein